MAALSGFPARRDERGSEARKGVLQNMSCRAAFHVSMATSRPLCRHENEGRFGHFVRQVPERVHRTGSDIRKNELGWISIQFLKVILSRFDAGMENAIRFTQGNRVNSASAASLQHQDANSFFTHEKQAT